MGTIAPPATGRHAWLPADRIAAPCVGSERPSQPHRSHFARKYRVGSEDHPLSGSRVATLTTRMGHEPARESPGTYTGCGKQIPFIWICFDRRGFGGEPPSAAGGTFSPRRSVRTLQREEPVPPGRLRG